MKDQTFEAILQAASELFAERGVYGASLGDIAKRLDMSKGTLYYYFPTKDELVNAAAERCVKGISGRLMAWVDTVREAGDPEEALNGLCDAFTGGNALRVFMALNNAVEPDTALEQTIDRAMGEWNVIIEVGALRLPSDAAARMKRMLSAVLPFLCGLAGLNADVDYMKEAFAALILG
ncbi:MAG: TetR/AcrR family transcriptional regulator [Clostridia bacterium]|nr:TetR/AcrR family transcriptional regulator [Clostridia bacterium]